MNEPIIMSLYINVNEQQKIVATYVVRSASTVRQ